MAPLAIRHFLYKVSNENAGLMQCYGFLEFQKDFAYTLDTC